MTATHTRTVGVPVALAAAIDALVVIVFATAGRVSHAEGVTFGGVVMTAWPFLVGAALGWVVAFVLLSRAPLDSAGGVLVWVGAVAGGMALRAVTGQGTAMSFIAVASVVTGVLLLGWRWAATRFAR